MKQTHALKQKRVRHIHASHLADVCISTVLVHRHNTNLNKMRAKSGALGAARRVCRCCNRRPATARCT